MKNRKEKHFGNLSASLCYSFCVKFFEYVSSVLFTSSFNDLKTEFI